MKKLTLFAVAASFAAIVLGGCGKTNTVVGKTPEMPGKCSYDADCPAGYVCDTNKNKCVLYEGVKPCNCATSDDCGVYEVCYECFCVPKAGGDKDIELDNAEESGEEPDGDDEDALPDNPEETDDDFSEGEETAPVICLPNKVMCREGKLSTCNSTGTAWFSEECAFNYVCVGAVCVPKVCNPGEVVKCVDENRIERCNELGTAITIDKCGINVRCENNSCVPIQCEPDKGYRCLGKTVVEKCGPTGDSYVIMECPDDTFCDEGECRSVECTPNALRCDANVVQFCNSLGTQWIDALDCAQVDALCDEGYCKPKICEPGSKTCSSDNKSLEVCNENGTAWKHDSNCSDFDPESSCKAGVCLTPCDYAAKIRSYEGCEFWAADLDNGDSDAQAAQYAIVVSNTHTSRNATVKIYNSSGVLKTEVVPPLDLKAFPLSPSNVIGSVKEKKAYRVVSDLPVSAYQFNPFTNELVYSNDASLLLPTHALGKKYVQMSLPQLNIASCSGFMGVCSCSDSGNYPSYFSVIASEDNTTVTFKPTSPTRAGGVPAYSAGQQVAQVLNKYDVLQIETASGSGCSLSCSSFFCDCKTGCYSNDLTGTIINSDKPVAVFGAHACNFLPANQWACDHVEHQLFPVETWGLEFVGTATSKRGKEPDWIKIVAVENGTNITFSPAVSGMSAITLNSGQSQFFSLNANGGMTNFIIKSDKPIMVGQFLSGQDSTGLGISAEAGDPAFFLLTPTEQFRRDYVFLIPSTYANDFVNVVAPKDANITIDGTTNLNSNSFSAVGDYRVTILKTLNDGTHKIVSDKPIGIYVYGYSQYVSYAYTGGLDLRLINVKE